MTQQSTHQQLPVTFSKDFHNEELVRKMEYTPLGRTGLNVSKIAIGGGALCQFYGTVDKSAAIATVHKALKSGINYIDTAPWYGQGKSEQLLGEALASVPRSIYYIGTKVGRYELEADKMFDFSAKKTKDSVVRSLALLQLNYVDVIQIHDIEFAPSLKIVLEETLPTLEEIVAEGKARHIGVTGYPLSTLRDAIAGAPGRFEVVLTYTRYSLIDQSLKEFLPFFKEHQIGVICASGHGMGLLTNAGPQSWHPAKDSTKELCRKAAAICIEAGVELGKLAMHHFVQLPGPATFLVGMQNELLLDMNLEAYFNGLTAEEEGVLKTLKENIFLESTNLHWEGEEKQKKTKW